MACSQRSAACFFTFITTHTGRGCVPLPGCGLFDLLHRSAEHFVRLATRASIVRWELVVGALNLSKPDDFLNAPFGGELFGGKFSALFEKEKELRKERAQSQKRPGSRGTKSQPQQSKPTFAWRTTGQVAVQPHFQQQQQLQQPLQTTPGWQGQPIAVQPPVQNPGTWQPPSQGKMRGNQRKTTSGRGRRHSGKRQSKPQRGGHRGCGGRGGSPLGPASDYSPSLFTSRGTPARKALQKKSGEWHPILKSETPQQISPCKFRIETLRAVVGVLSPHQRGATLDLQDAYLHIPIDPGSQKWLRFALTTALTSSRYYHLACPRPHAPIQEL